MVEKPEYLALINPVPSLPAKDQRALCARFSPKEEFEVGKDGDYDQFIRLVRPPRVVLVAYAALLGEQTGSKDARADSMTALKVAIHKKETYAVEAGGRDSRTKWAAMKRDGKDMCRRFAQGAKSALNGRRGTPPIAEQLSDDNIRDLLVIKADRKKYPNWPSRVAAMRRRKIKPLPGRLWFIYQLEAVARSRGLVD